MIHKVRKMCECGCERDAFDPRGSNRVQERVSNAWDTVVMHISCDQSPADRTDTAPSVTHIFF